VEHRTEAVLKQAPARNQTSLIDSLDIEWLPVDALLPGDSPRLTGEDLGHTQMLAKLDVPLPPIVVHRQTMRIIDGTHRLGAAVLRGDQMIEARLFDGTEREAFVLAVQANIAHGLPLSLADRTRAAERIIAAHPDSSDRAIASVAGLGARTVGNLRRRLQDGTDAERPEARKGLDGRVRPLDGTGGRLRALAIIEQRPEASLREVAREAGVSPTTVRDVRQRVQRGEDPVPQVRRRGGSTEVLGRGSAETGGPSLVAMLQGLQNDPSLRFSESGRTVLRWILARAVRSDEHLDVMDKVPPHCTYIVAEVARACAGEWQRLANELDRRNTPSA
jgi:ParB-like chromosome segregation protein Spo0J